MPFPVDFYGTQYSSLYVNNNGNLTFGQSFGQYTPQSLNQLNLPMIAPFWADVDTRVGPQVTYGYGTVGGHAAFGVNWLQVGCYSENDSVTDTFQALLIDRPDLGQGRWQIEYNYGPLVWDSGQASGGDARCLGGTAARAGYTSGHGASCELSGSGVNGGLLAGNLLTGLGNGDQNSAVRGRYVFDVSSSGQPNGCGGSVALGDSYSSGQGTVKSAATTWTEEPCWQGPLAWPVQLSNDFPAAPRLDQSGLIACSGDTTSQLISNQLPKLDHWVSQNGSPSLATVTIGGDDLNFAPLLTACVEGGYLSAVALPRRQPATACSNYMNNELRYLESGAFTNQLVKTYRDISAKAGGANRIVVVGYPHLFPSPANAKVLHPDTHCLWMGGESGVFLSLFYNAQERLDAVTSQAASEAGVRFIKLGDLFDGHELCTGSPYINTLAWGKHNDGHPNAIGQSVIAKYVGAQLGYLSGNGTGTGSGANHALLTPAGGAKKPGKMSTRTAPQSATGVPTTTGAAGRTPAPAPSAGQHAASQADAGSGLSASAGLSDGTASQPYTGFVWASGGTEPYTWSVSSGNLPDGLSLDPATGIVSGTPTTPGTFSFTVTATDSSSPAQTASEDESITIGAQPALAVGAPTLPNPTTGQQYSVSLTAGGGNGPYTWAVTSGNLPAGLSLDPGSGVISGTPTAAGNSTFTVTVTDSSDTAQTATSTYTLDVAAGGSALTLGAPQLPAGTQGTGYTGQLTSTGGTGPLYWSVTGGSLPPGLSLDSGTGQLTGIPTASGTYPFTAQAEDSAAAPSTATENLTITVAAGSAPAIDAVTLPDATQGQAYDNVVTASGGVTPYTWSITSGNLPDGLSLDSGTGEITGTPTTPGNYSFTVSAADSSTPSPQSDSVSLSLTVGQAPPPPAMTASDTVTDGTTGEAYNASVIPAGGTGPYTYTVTSGTLPDGLTLDPNAGTITGTPATPGTSTATIQVTDNSSPTPQAATDDLSITIAAPTALAITTSSLPDGAAGTAYADQIATTGGTGPYTYSVTGGSLPDGLTLDPASGIIYGTPTTTGQSSFTVTVTDSASTPATATADLTLNTGAAPAVSIDTGSLPDAAQGVSYSQILSASGGAAPYTWSVISGSLPDGLSLDPATGVVSGTPTGSGASTFTVQASDSSSPSALTATQTFTVNVQAAAPLAIDTTALDPAAQGTYYSETLNAEGGTSPVTWSVTAGTLPDGLTLDAASGTISGTPSGSGTSSFTIEATDSSTPAPETATQAFSLEVTPQAPAQSPQSISFTAPASGAVSGSAVLAATGGGSGNPVVFTVDSSSGTGVCAVSGTDGTTLSYTGAGSCVIDANQAGDANYFAAPQVQQTISVAKGAQSISFTAPASGAVGGSAALSATGGGSGNPVVFTVDPVSSAGACTVSGTHVSYTGTGNCVIDANQAGNANYLAAPEVQQQIVIAKGTQTIKFTAPASGAVGGSAVLSATGGASGNPVVFTVDASSGHGVCTVTGTKVTYAATGSCVIDANQAGNANYAAAAQVHGTITVAKAASKSVLGLSASSVAYGHEKAVTFTVTVSPQYSGTPSGTVTVKTGKTTLCTATLTNAKATCSSTSPTVLAPAKYSVTAAYAGNAGFNGSTSSAQTLTVTKESTKTALRLSRSSVVYGKEKGFAFAVTVSPQYSGTPNGTVTVKAGSVTVCANKTLASGKFTCVLPGAYSLKTGTYSVIAAYSGATDFAASKSGTVTLKVVKS